MKAETERDKVCDLYEEYFEKALSANVNFRREFNNLVELYKEQGKLALFCWCAPKRCHAETIARKIIEASKR